MQGFFGIFVKIPDGMIEIEEDVFVFFDGGYISHASKLPH
jgi:hypothetical protein